MTLIGYRIRNLRKQRDLTQGQLAAYSGVAQSHISRLENDNVDSLGSEPLSKLANALNTTTDYLLGLTPNPFPPDQSTVPSTEIEWMLLEKFRDLDEEHQRLVIAQLDLLLTHIPRSQPPATRMIRGETLKGEETPR